MSRQRSFVANRHFAITIDGVVDADRLFRCLPCVAMPDTEFASTPAATMVLRAGFHIDVLLVMASQRRDIIFGAGLVVRIFLGDELLFRPRGLTPCGVA